MSKGFDIAFSLLITGLILGKLHFEMKGVNFTKESYVDELYLFMKLFVVIY